MVAFTHSRRVSIVRPLQVSVLLALSRSPCPAARTSRDTTADVLLVSWTVFSTGFRASARFISGTLLHSSFETHPYVRSWELPRSQYRTVLYFSPYLTKHLATFSYLTDDVFSMSTRIPTISGGSTYRPVHVTLQGSGHVEVAVNSISCKVNQAMSAWSC